MGPRYVFLAILIAVFACAVRVYPAWAAVFGGERVNFLETDAWYHVRLVENQVRNYPWRVTLDPYAALGGQFVPIAPLFDTITATAVVILHGRDATTHDVERTAAFVPPILGALTVLFVFLLARRLFDARAGLLAAGLLAVLPGHFMDRTQLGFVDHHALEALLAIATLWAIARALARPPSLPATSVPGTPNGDVQIATSADRPVERGRRSPWGTEVALRDGGLVGLTLGLYLLGWGSGAFLVAILGVWLLMLVPLARTAAALAQPARVTGIGALIALALIVLFQDPRMHRYGSQIVGLIGLAGIALALHLAAARRTTLPSATMVAGSVAIVGAVALLTTWWLAPDFMRHVLIDVGRLAPDAMRMSVLEARPLFLYPGEFHWLQPWDFFRTGFYAGAIALIVFTARIWRGRRPADALVWVFGVVTFVATIGQNRFGYYLMTACALFAGWLGSALLEWSGVWRSSDAPSQPVSRVPLAREIAVVAVTAMFAPNVGPSVLLAPRAASLAPYWQDVMEWLARETPAPFVYGVPDGDYYFARYPRDVSAVPNYTVMNWWDQGYWIIQRARRVPVANPTQGRAPNAARFYVETDEAQAHAMLQQEFAFYVLSDWELPFRRTNTGAIMGRFQSVADWAGARHADYYEIYYRREDGNWIPMWVFHEAYYRSMAYRLSVAGGRAMLPANATTVLTVADREDASGRRFRHVLTYDTYATYEAALQAAAKTTARTMIVGLDPWQAAFPVAPLTLLQQVYEARTPEQQPQETPWVRVFAGVNSWPR